jgi:hypothetical protein
MRRETNVSGLHFRTAAAAKKSNIRAKIKA